MNNYIASHLRHFITAIAAIGSYLLLHKLVSPSQADAINQAGTQLIEPLTTLGSLLAVAVIRLAITGLGKSFPALADKISLFVPGGSGTNGGAGSGLSLVILGLTAAGLMGCLPSCSTAQLAEAKAIQDAVPVHISTTTHGVTASYDSRNGLAVIVDPHSGK